MSSRMAFRVPGILHHHLKLQLGLISSPLLRYHGRIVALALQSGQTTRWASSTASSSVKELENQPTLPPASTPTPHATHEDLLEVYREQIAQGRLTWDDEQVRCIMKLRHLLNELADYTPPLDLLARLSSSAPSEAKKAQDEADNASWWDRKGKGKAEEVFGSGDQEKSLVRVLSGEEELANLRTPKGIMITGPPGTGKSQVLSLFFNLLPTPHKARWHYHAFTLHIYRQVFQEMERRRHAMPKMRPTENMERAAKKGWRSVFANGRWEDGEENDSVEREETIPFVIARDMILKYHILYFDEMQLVDASSAALLRDVLSWYWRLGGVIVTCSNRVPDDLYHHGVQKDRMAGFLTALKARCEVVELDGGKDWRTAEEGRNDVRVRWFNEDTEGFEESWQEAIRDEKAQPKAIGVYGRKLRVPLAAGKTCRMSFTDLCEQPLGPADYISLASTFSTIFIDAVPVLFLRNKNEARRLINLVDALYEARCQIYISAASPVSSLFFPDAVTASAESLTGIPTTGTFDHGDTNESIMAAEALSETLHTAAHPNISVYNPGERAARERKEEKEAREASAFGVLGIWTGEDERFAYKRAVSRLIEMTTSPRYAQEEWIPLTPGGRAWETKIPTNSPAPAGSSGTGPKHPDRRTSRAGNENNDDFAVEAGYSRPGLLQTPASSPSPPPAQVQQSKEAEEVFHGGPREDAPKIGEKHVWGVVDGWGEKAGKWGRGPKAFKKGDE